MRPGITVVTPTIAPRGGMLRRAKASVAAQALPAEAHVIEHDVAREGAAVARDRGLRRVDTEWVAFLDDDDEMLPGHLSRLMWWAGHVDADYVFSWYEVMGGGTDPRPDEFGLAWDPAEPRQTTVTTLVRTGLALEAGFVDPSDAPLDSPDRLYAGEDWYFTRRCNELGGRISHLPEVTWLWWHHGQNTSGLPRNWS